jgi:hypothetical protein
MANFILLVAILLAGTSFIALNTQTLGAYGLTWASDVCWAAPLACDYPHQVAYLAAGLGGLWIVMKFASALRD